MFETQDGWTCTVPDGTKMRDYVNTTIKMLKRCNFWVNPDQYLNDHYWKSPIKFVVSNKTCPELTAQYGRIDFKIIVISTNLFYVTKDTKRHTIPKDAAEVDKFIRTLIEYLEDPISREKFNLNPKSLRPHDSTKSLFMNDPHEKIVTEPVSEVSPRRIYFNSCVLPDVIQKSSRNKRERRLHKALRYQINEDISNYFEEKEYLLQLEKTSKNVIDSVLESIVEETKKDNEDDDKNELPVHPSLLDKYLSPRLPSPRLPSPRLPSPRLPSPRLIDRRTVTSPEHAGRGHIVVSTQTEPVGNFQNTAIGTNTSHVDEVEEQTAEHFEMLDTPRPSPRRSCVMF